MKRVQLAVISLIVLLALGTSVIGAQTEDTTLIPIGGGYTDTFPGFIEATLQRLNGSRELRIVVLPTAYSTHAENISAEERSLNMQDAEKRRSQLEEACLAQIPARVTCNVQIAPIFTQTDARDPANLDYFTDDLAAVYILGGDQTIAMHALQGTPVENALADAYQRGVFIAGTSAGLSMQSAAMIAGYSSDEFDVPNALQAGAVDVWDSANERGLPFGVQAALLEQHFWERGRLPRLLNALAQPDVPHVGIGVDTYTAAFISHDRVLDRVFGLYTVGIFDAETFDAAAEAEFPNDILSLHQVLFHLAAPGDFAYDLETRQFSLAEPPQRLRRSFDDLRAPAGAGMLFLACNAPGSLATSAALSSLVEQAGATGGNILVVVYSQVDQAQTALAEAYRKALQDTFKVASDYVYPASAELPQLAEQALSQYSGVIVVGDDASTLDIQKLLPLREIWLTGTPLLLDQAAAALAGSFYAAQGPTPEANDDNPYADTDYIQGAFIQGNTTIQPGLDLIKITVEPRAAEDYRWGRLVALAYEHPDRIAVGLNEGAAVQITPEGGTALGTDGVFVLDLRTAELALGDNNAYVFANGLLDVFAPGETIRG